MQSLAESQRNLFLGGGEGQFFPDPEKKAQNLHWRMDGACWGQMARRSEEARPVAPQNRTGPAAVIHLEFRRPVWLNIECVSAQRSIRSGLHMGEYRY